MGSIQREDWPSMQREELPPMETGLERIAALSRRCEVPSDERSAGKPHATICGSCALKAHGIQPSAMATAAKRSAQPRTESCVVAPTALRSVDREVVGRNASERKDNPEIDRGRSSRPYLSMGKAETQAAVGRVTWDASGVRTAGMQPKDSMGTRESRPIQAMTCKVRQADTARET